MSHFRYLLPDYDFGLADHMTSEGLAFVRDHISIACGGRSWQLRKLYRIDDQLVSAPQAYRLRKGRTGLPLVDSPCAALETEGKASQRHELDAAATDLCWILQVARGSQLRWTEIHEIVGDTVRPLESRSSSRLPQWDGGSPLKNAGDGALCRFVQNAWPVFQHDPAWWSVTCDWFAWAHATSTIEVSGLICSMLLERITDFVMSDLSLPPQIDPVLNDLLDEGSQSRAAISADLTALWRKSIPAWPEPQSESILSMVRQWNNSPSYQNQIRLAFQKYRLEPPPSSLLANRHSLAHNGLLSHRTSDPGRYLSEIIGTVVRLLLRMLHYSGPYFVLSQGVAHLPPMPSTANDLSQ